jgi:hypothetical protein
VLPEFRRQGIARRLVRASLDFVRAREGTVVLLDVISGNVPAYSLYRQLGFEHFAGSITFDYEAEQALPEHPVPHGYQVLSLRASDWTRCAELEQRIVPADVQRYEPRDPGQYVQSLPDRLAAYIINQIQGTREERAAVRTVPGDRMVAWGGYHARMRRGGVNRITMHVDPAHPQLARPLLHYLIRSAGAISPGRRIEFGVSPWQHAVLEAARETGLTRRLEHHRLGMRP